MSDELVFHKHLTSSIDLITTREETRAGFVALALEKTHRSVPFVEAARILKSLAISAKRPVDLIKMPQVRSGLISAAGISDKAARNMEEEDKDEAIKRLIDNYLIPAGDNFVEELIFRFLIIKGEALGGSMKNFGGKLAERKLTRTILATLSLQSITYKWSPDLNGTWLNKPDDETDVESQIKVITWTVNDKPLVLMYNKRVPIVNKNVDLILLSCDPKDAASALGDPSCYKALGELKGGIDPAGADEHWKTAYTALKRIRDPFISGGYDPAIFFVGAAIVPNMADELWHDLDAKLISNAANLNKNDHIISLCNWLINM